MRNKNDYNYCKLRSTYKQSNMYAELIDKTKYFPINSMIWHEHLRKPVKILLS